MTQLIISIFFALSLAWAGQEVGNGGGFAMCADKNFYSYDFLITQKAPFGALRSGMTSNQHLAHIRNQLLRLQDPLLSSYNEFMSSLFSQLPGKKFQWFQRNNLPLLWEPDLDVTLPMHCRKVRKQAATYFKSYPDTRRVDYAYDQNLLKQVEAQPNGGLQVSFLLIHEWLWNFFPRQRFDRLAMLNRLLHSENLDKLSKADFDRMKAQLLQ